MGDDEIHPQPSLLRDEATEASPLLGPPQHSVDPDPNSAPAVTSNGTFTGSSTPGSGSSTTVGAGDEEGRREGIPEMAKRLHILLPAIGIGIFLCALDQLLAVATYAKIGSDLHALNSTSWIATA